MTKLELCHGVLDQLADTEDPFLLGVLDMACDGHAYCESFFLED